MISRQMIMRRSNYSTMGKLVESLKNRPEIKQGFESLKKETNKIGESAKEAFAKAKSTVEEGTSKAKEKINTESSSSQSSSTGQQQTSGQANPSGFFDNLRQNFASLSKTTVFQDISGAVKDTKKVVVDDNAYRYGGMTSKAYRSKIKEKRLAGFSETAGEIKVEANPEAGANVVLHKDSKWKSAWNSFKDSNPVVQGIFTMRRKYEESDNPLVNSARFLSERLRDLMGPVFEESEHAQAITELKEIDPEFSLDEFMKDAREFMIPEVLEAYVHWDPKTLKQWCSEGVYNVLDLSREETTSKGHTIEGKLLDLRNVELVMAKIVDGTPLLILSFKTQQIEVVRDTSGEIVAGSPDKIIDVYYVWVVAKDVEKPSPLTKGWKIAEFAIQGVREGF